MAYSVCLYISQLCLNLITTDTTQCSVYLKLTDFTSVLLMLREKPIAVISPLRWPEILLRIQKILQRFSNLAPTPFKVRCAFEPSSPLSRLWALRDLNYRLSEKSNTLIHPVYESFTQITYCRIFIKHFFQFFAISNLIKSLNELTKIILCLNWFKFV